MKQLITLVVIVYASKAVAQVQTDKVAHFGVGYVVSASTTAILQRYDVKGAVWYGIGLGTLLGIVKELYDKHSGNGQPSYSDAFSTIGGSVAGSVTVRISINNKRKI